VSLCARLEDAANLYTSGRAEGALISVLIAVAATARKRYPRPIRDKEAFTKFVGEEMFVISGWIPNWPMPFEGKPRPISDILYEFIRCELFHEGKLPGKVVMKDDDKFALDCYNGKFTFSRGLLFGLSKAVVSAPENASEFEKGNPLDAVRPPDRGK
jgi:hypothetical protein